MPSKYLVQQIIKEYLEDNPDINGVLDLIRDLDSYVTNLQQRVKQYQMLMPSAWTTEKHHQKFEEIYIWLCKSGYTIGTPHLWEGGTYTWELSKSKDRGWLHWSITTQGFFLRGLPRPSLPLPQALRYLE